MPVFTRPGKPVSNLLSNQIASVWAAILTVADLNQPCFNGFQHRPSAVSDA